MPFELGAIFSILLCGNMSLPQYRFSSLPSSAVGVVERGCRDFFSLFLLCELVVGGRCYCYCCLGGSVNSFVWGVLSPSPFSSYSLGRMRQGVGNVLLGYEYL